MRQLYLFLAALLFGLAVLGAFLPVLPTTPFLLLTSWCLVRSSPALHEKLRRSPLFGPLIADWDRHHGVRLHVKLSALAMLAIAVCTSLAFGSLPKWLAASLIVLALIGATVILRLKTVRDEPS